MIGGISDSVDDDGRINYRCPFPPICFDNFHVVKDRTYRRPFDHVSGMSTVVVVGRLIGFFKCKTRRPRTESKKKRFQLRPPPAAATACCLLCKKPLSLSKERRKQWEVSFFDRVICYRLSGWVGTRVLHTTIASRPKVFNEARKPAMMYGEKRGVGCGTVVVAAVVRKANPATEQQEI